MTARVVRRTRAYFTGCNPWFPVTRFFKVHKHFFYFILFYIYYLLFFLLCHIILIIIILLLLFSVKGFQLATAQKQSQRGSLCQGIWLFFALSSFGLWWYGLFLSFFFLLNLFKFSQLYFFLYSHFCDLGLYYFSQYC